MPTDVHLTGVDVLGQVQADAASRLSFVQLPAVYHRQGILQGAFSLKLYLRHMALCAKGFSPASKASLSPARPVPRQARRLPVARGNLGQDGESSSNQKGFQISRWTDLQCKAEEECSQW